MYSGTYLFQASIEVTKYERVVGKIAPPFEKVTITFNNEEGGMGSDEGFSKALTKRYETKL